MLVGEVDNAPRSETETSEEDCAVEGMPIGWAARDIRRPRPSRIEDQHDILRRHLDLDESLFPREAVRVR